MWPRLLIAGLALMSGMAATLAPGQEPAPPNEVGLGRTVIVGPTGYSTRRLIMASACPQACPWGELGEFVRDAMAPLGYEIILCRNCNRRFGPPLVARASLPPPLESGDLRRGTTERVNAPVDFGVTESGMLAWAYRGTFIYRSDGAMTNLRLIARIEDPTYLLVAVRADSGITDLAEIAMQRRPVRILTDHQPASDMVLEHYGLEQEQVERWGGSVGFFMTADARTPFDVIVSSIASPANNPESAPWSIIGHSQSLRFLDLPEALLGRLVNEADMQPVVARWGLLPGIERSIATAGRSGEAIFARADMPDRIAYDLARAIDARRGELRWFARPYSYDPRTVWSNFDVPLHPGARRYYREAGYMRSAATAGGLR
jgi:TRAP-type uncharacterized transport system substrate-binding protein